MKGSRTVMQRASRNRPRANRKTTRDAVRVTVGVRIRAARKIVVFVFLAWSGLASATTYYISSSTGNDANNGASSSTAWQTIAHVNGQSFQPGDSVLFKRGDVWNESLAPASSGSSGNPITFDAYGTGAAPNLTGYYAVPATAWVLVTGNAWKAPVPATYTTINFCLFGSIWGQKVAAASSNLTAQWDFYLANGYVYVYSVGNPATYYSEAIVPMGLSNVPVINVNGRSWLTFQHFLVNWFDQYGVYVQGTSDHLVFANMEADSMIPQGTQPLGFYVDESAPGPGDIKIYNSEAHLNYDGFRFDGSATAITMVNDKGYANRDGALVDNTGAVTYSYCHFYASSLAVAGSTDVEWTSGNGPTAGAGNVAADTAPAVQVYQRYPAQVTLTVDDSGMTPGADTYYAGTVLPVADAAGVPVGAAITVGYPLAQTLVSEFQGWVNAGRDVTSHSMSHTYYTNTDALEIQYTGSGTAATLSISNKTLVITVTGASDGVTYNLTQGQAEGTILGLQQALAATGKFTTSYLTPCQGPYGTGCSAYTAQALLAQDLADVSGQDVRTSVYHMQLDVTRLTTDEITLSRGWMTANLTGLPATPVYVYPGGYETTTMQGITAGVPYAGSRGALKEDLGVKDTYADGFNVQNITSFGVNPSWQGVSGVTPAILNQKIQALVWKESVWGVPWGIFWHLNELTNNDPVGGSEITNLIQDFKNSGATMQTNTSLVNWLLSGTQETGTDGNYYYKSPATSMALDFRPTKNSPVVDAGQNLGAAYELDINGVNQNSYGSGWEIGAHVYEGYAVYGEGTGAGSFTIGSGPAPAPVGATLPSVWVNNYEGDALFSYELSLPSTWVTVAAPGCTFHAPYWTGSPTSAGLQSAVNDIEACRTATGAGIALDIPAALYTVGGATGLVIPQTNATTSTNFLVLRSAQDNNLPNGQTVCSHGIQDNLTTSTDIGLINPDCAGDVLAYQLGTTVTSIPAGAFTLANGTVTNTTDYNDVQYMWTAECSGVNCTALNFCNASGTASTPTCATNIGPDHWLIEDAEVRMVAGSTGNANIIGMTAGGVGVPTALTQYPAHIHLRKIWQHGDWTSLTAGLNSVSSGIAFNCSYCSVVDSQESQNLRPGSEGHSILVNGPGPYKFDHNWLEGQSSGIFAGGNEGTSPFGIPSLNTFQDVEMRRNRLTFPYAWLGQMQIPSGNTHWSGQNIVRKNIEEFKNGQRILMAGNILENVDNSGGQSGPEMDAQVKNWLVNYELQTTDVTFTDNIIRNSCQGFEQEGTGNSAGNGTGNAYAENRTWYANNLFYNVSASNPGCAGVNATNDTFSAPNFQWQGTITQVDATHAQFVGNCSVASGSTGGTVGTCPGELSSITVNTGGSCSSNGSLTISAPAQGGMQAAGTYTCAGSVVTAAAVTQQGSLYLSAPTVTAGSTGATFTVNLISSPGNPPQGAEVMDIAAGDSVAIFGCQTVSAFNQTLRNLGSGIGYWPSGLGTTVTTGSTVWSGSFSTANITLSYSSTGITAGTTDNSGYCMLSQLSGNPQNYSFTHNTTISDSKQFLTSGSSRSLPPYAKNSLFRDSIIVAGTGSGTYGWYMSVAANPQEGTNTEGYNHDVNSLTVDRVVIPGRSASSYTAYGNNPNYPDASPVMYFPATAYCTGASSTPACVGFTGAMSATAMPLTLPDYHNYELRSDSSFYAGNADQASDGTSMGANIPAIDAAQTQTLYVCASACGLGPYPDSLTGPAGAAFFGFSESNTNGGGWPTVSYGMQRFWDSPPLQWPYLNTASGVFSFSNLDSDLALAYSNGALEGMYTLARTPTWASSKPTDATCNYTGSGSGQGDGECDPPSDLNSDGSGADAIWKAWITAIATHVNSPGYTATHAHIKYWEIWNEPDTQPFWAGSIAQLARLTEDANCIITGRGVIHENGNGTATACTATAIDPTAQIVMASAHAKGAALTYGQNELYCNNTSGIPAYQLPCPNPANAIAAAVDIINFHMKPGNETGNNCPAPTPCTAESAMQWYVANIDSMLQPAELAKPLWDGEAQYSTTGFINTYADSDMAASFMPRFYLMDWSLGISGIAWYYASSQAEPASAETSYQQTYNWLVNSSLITPCTASGTVWSCMIANGGTQYLIMWDTSQSCSSGSCTTGNQVVASRWTQYQDMTSATTPTAISGHSVPIGIKAVVLH